MKKTPKTYILPDYVRPRGIMCWGSPGAAKSVFAGKLIVRSDHRRKLPGVVFDPLGTVLDAFLDEDIPERVIVCDMAAKEYAVPFPLYQRFGDEPLLDAVQRWPETVKLSDPAILAAPIHGYNPFLEVATHLGVVLATLKLPLIAAPLLIKNPEYFKEQLKDIPAIAPSVQFLSSIKSANLQMFRSKLLPFHDESMQAICCASEPGIDWEKVVDEGYTVFFDFRHVTNEQKKSFLMLWTLKSFLTYVRTRTVHSPISLVVDEIKNMFMDPQGGDTAIATETIQLLDVYARNYNVWPTLLTQDPLSFGPKVQQSLLGIGTQIVGSMHNTEAATLLASHLVTHNPGQYSTLDKDAYTSGQRFKQLKPFHFLVRPAVKGGVSRRLYPVTIERLVSQWTPRERIEEVRRVLIARSGQPTAALLSEIASRVPRLPTSDAKPKRDTLPKNGSRTLPPQDDE